MTIYPAGCRPSQKGPAEYFVGSARIDMRNSPPEPARASAALVTFEPGARYHWHSHPFGQTLIVVSGRGWTQCEDREKVEIRAGDVT